MVGMKSDVGIVRTLNEDYAGYSEEAKYKLYVVADGMGGHNAGEVASKMAVEAVKSYAKENYDNEGTNVLENAIEFANSKIYNKEVIVNEIALVESRLKMVFVNTLTAIQVGNQWSAVVYYNEPNLGQKRLVVSGQTSLKVDEYTYSLTPIKNGVTIKDVKSGNIYKLEVKGR